MVGRSCCLLHHSSGVAMITAENLTKTYGPKTAVDGISFTVRPGQVTGFLGPDGAGPHAHLRTGPQMRAAVYRRFGGPDLVRVEELPRPPVSRSDVLIRVRASTVSAADHRARSRDVPRGLWLL